MLLSLLRTFAASCQPGGSFFGLDPWYKYLDGNTDAFGKCVPSLNGDIANLWLIGLVIIDDLIRVAGMVAVGFIIFGGFQYMTSSGEPDRTKKAKDTILNALIGLVIAIAASSIVSFIGSRITP